MVEVLRRWVALLLLGSLQALAACTGGPFFSDGGGASPAAAPSAPRSTVSEPVAPREPTPPLETARTEPPAEARPARPATPPTPLAAPSRAPAQPARTPAQPAAPVPPTPLALSALIGLDQDEAGRLIGRPSVIGEQPPAIVWEYRDPTCALKLNFFLEVKAKTYRVLTAEVQGTDGSKPAGQACLDAIRGNRATTRN